MDIGFYIADLLRNQDEVSLPGLGTFTRERVPGSYDISNSSFRPPSYRVSFNTRTSDFASLSEYISLKKNLSRPSAEYFVKKFTSSLFELLQTSGTAEVKPLGIIRQNEDIIIFEASPSTALEGRFYGLRSIADRSGIPAPPAPATLSPADESTIDSNSIVKGSFIEDFITGQGNEEQEEEEERFEETRSNRTLMIVLGVFLLGISTVILLYFFNTATKDMVNGMFMKPAEVKAAAKPPVDTTKTTLPPVSDSINSQPAAVTEPADSLVSSLSSSKESKPEAEITTYEIVGATFGKRSEAESYIKTMKGKGIEARILENMPGTLFKVSIGSFPDSKTAQDELNRIVQEVEKSAWTTKYKSKKIQ